MSKKIAMIIAPKDFRDEEYFIPRELFLEKGIEVITVSSQKGSALGTYGGVVEVNLTLGEVKANDFDAIIFVGGSGAINYFNEPLCQQLAQSAVKQGKVLGAICIAPAILAQSGVLKGKRATVWSSEMDKSAIKILKNNGALFEPKPVVIDEKIITAAGPKYARQFAEKMIEALQKFSK